VQRKEIIIIGGGIVGLSSALHLQRRGWKVLLVDRSTPGQGTSFGNAGLIQREAVFPPPFPRHLSELLSYLGNRSSRVQYCPTDIISMLPMLWKYWKNSGLPYTKTISHAYGALIQHCLGDHQDLAEWTNTKSLYTSGGWVQLFQSSEKFQREIKIAEIKQKDFGVEFDVWSSSTLYQKLPGIQSAAGAIHWTQPLAVRDPYALSEQYYRYFLANGGTFATANVQKIQRSNAQWQVYSQGITYSSKILLLAMGAWTEDLLRPLGFTPAVFTKRGYHRHFLPAHGRSLPFPVLDTEGGYVLVPTDHGIRLTSGAEFCRRDAPATQRAMALAEKRARWLFPELGVSAGDLWLGHRPCSVDMLPIIGSLATQPGLWLAFGHCHQGLTLGPTTGRLLADLLEETQPAVDPLPYSPNRFIL